VAIKTKVGAKRRASVLRREAEEINALDLSALSVEEKADLLRRLYLLSSEAQHLLGVLDEIEAEAVTS